MPDSAPGPDLIPAPASFSLDAPAAEAWLSRPLIAAEAIASLCASGCAPSQAGFSADFLRELAPRLADPPAAGHPQELSRSRELSGKALKRLTETLLPFPVDGQAWLDGLARAGLLGSIEALSPLAIDPSGLGLGRSPLPNALIHRWIESGLIHWRSSESASWLCHERPDVFDNPLGARLFRRFLPGGPDRLAHSAFSPRESDERALSAMIQAGVFCRLAIEYDAADRHGLAHALEAQLARDTLARAAGSLRPPGRDPLYAQLLDWGMERLGRNADWIRGERLFHGPDFHNALREIMLERSALHAQADAIEAELPHAPASRRPGL